MRKDKRPAYKSVLKSYRKQKSRGSEGFGYIAIKDNKVVSYRRAQFEHEIIKMIEKEDAPEILFHHRFPTHGPNIPELAHPLYVEHDSLEHQYFVLHNGVIRNTKELRDKHETQGFSYETIVTKQLRTKHDKTYEITTEWNDSESLAIETALAFDGKKRTIDTIGPAAVIGLQMKGDEVVSRFFYRNTVNPLKYSNNEHMTCISSEGKGESINAFGVHRMNEQGIVEEIKGILAPASYTEYSSRSYEREGMQSINDVLGASDAQFGVTVLPVPQKPMLGIKDVVREFSPDIMSREMATTAKALSKIRERLAHITKEMTIADVAVYREQTLLRSQLEYLLNYQDALAAEILDRIEFEKNNRTENLAWT